ncbi:MAG: hypothetical protein NDI60_05515 [Elusimicrobiales bacterium]|nr:hypothetical protein [Elusimicrobiales bacterium]
MKTILAAIILALTVPYPLKAEINFDSASGDILPGLSEYSRIGAPVPAPEMVQEEPEGCTSFSVESAMRQIPVYDQRVGGDDNSDSNSCYAVVAAHMFDHWALGRGGNTELISPLMLSAARRQARGETGPWKDQSPDGGDELEANVLLSMAQEGACTLGVTAGSRQSLSVDEELQLASAGRPGEQLRGREGFAAAAQPEVQRSISCRAVPVRSFKPLYASRPRQANGQRRAFNLQEFRGFFARNTANQPVAIKARYYTIFGDGKDAGSPHWALVIARQMREGRCQYQVRNSMGADTPLVWVDEIRLQHAAASLALLTQ